MAMANEFPILSRMQYDGHIRVVDVAPDFTMDQVAAACAAYSVGTHLPPPEPGKPLRIRPTTDDDNAAPFPADMTVAGAELQKFDCVDIYIESDTA